MNYNMNIETKYMIWEKSSYNIEAENLLEAKLKLVSIIEEGKEYEQEEGFIETRDLLYTQEELNINNNNGKRTKLASTDNDSIFWDNVDKTIQ